MANFTTWAAVVSNRFINLEKPGNPKPEKTGFRNYPDI